MKKKASASKRNRHTGRINEYKRSVMEHASKTGEVLKDSKGTLYSSARLQVFSKGFSMPSRLGTSIVRGAI